MTGPIEIGGATPRLELTWAEFGEVVTAIGDAGAKQSHYVLHACDYLTRGYYCCSCACYLANLGNLVIHLEPGGRHHVATFCQRHRVYEAADAEQIEGFRRLQQRDLGL